MTPLKKQIYSLFAAAFLVLVHQLLLHQAADHFLISLIANMQWQLSVMFLLAALVVFALRQSAAGTVLTVYGLGVMTWLVLVAAPSSTAMPQGARDNDLRVYFQNVSFFHSRENVDAMALMFAELEVDVLALVEVHPTLVQALSEQLGKPPAVQHIAGPQGCAIWTRKNAAGRLLPMADGSLACTVDQDGVSVMTAHPLPPVNARLFNLQLAILDQLKQWMAARTDVASIVVGDFNMTATNPHIKNRFGVVPFALSWGTEALHTAPFSMPLDYAVVSGGILTEYRLMPSLGSDHKGFVVGIIPD